MKPEDKVLHWELKIKDKVYKGAFSVYDLEKVDDMAKRLEFNFKTTMQYE